MDSEDIDWHDHYKMTFFAMKLAQKKIGKMESIVKKARSDLVQARVENKSLRQQLDAARRMRPRTIYLNEGDRSRRRRRSASSKVHRERPL